MNYSVLLLCNNQILINKIKFIVEENNYIFSLIQDQNEINKHQLSKYHSIIIDLTNPCINIKLCNFIRQQNKQVNILTLLNNDEFNLKLECIENGANDYFMINDDFVNLSLKLKSDFYRRNIYEVKKLNNNHIIFDLTHNLLIIDGKEKKLLTKEVKLLEFFLAHKNQIIQRYQLLSAVWSYDENATTRTVDVHVAKLRKKLGSASDAHRYIQTIRNQGYKFIFPE